MGISVSIGGDASLSLQYEIRYEMMILSLDRFRQRASRMEDMYSGFEKVW